MPKMPKTLQLKDPRGITSPREIVDLLTQWQQQLMASYEHTFADVHHKEMQYYDIDGKRWRMGPWPPRTATFQNGDFSADPADWNFELQYYTGSAYAQDWRDNSNWRRMTRSYAGSD